MSDRPMSDPPMLRPRRRPLGERKVAPDVVTALEDLQTAREGFQRSLDELTSATQSALDVPSKIRKNPVKTAALVGGAGFMLAGGPRRVLRFAVGRVRPGKPARSPGLLPPEIERVLKDAGLAKDPDLRRALDDDFAEYLKSKGRYDPRVTGATTFWRTFDRVAGPLGTASARVLVERLMEADRDRTRRLSEARKKAHEQTTSSS